MRVQMNKKDDVYIVAAYRSPIGSNKGNLSSLSATELGSKVLSYALKKVKIEPESVDEVFIGCALPAGLGQNPAQTVATLAKVPSSKNFTTINKVCASGLRAVILGAQQIQLSKANIVVAGGIESMSNVPSYVPKMQSENISAIDGMIRDGLSDPICGTSMGVYAEQCAENEKIDRKTQDDYAIRSYTLSKTASDSGDFDPEIVPIVSENSDIKISVTKDQIRDLDINRMRSCRPAFKKETGTVTGPNSSQISDGAACLILASAKAVKQYSLRPLVVIRSYADAGESDVSKFTIAPTLAINKCLESANLSIDNIDYFEINEAFSVVALANQKLLNLDLEKLNVRGGAVSLGHPIGCSGARILVTLINILLSKKAKLGCAAICNGGGGASAIVVETINND